MKIIERGVLPAEREWKVSCATCKTRFECLSKEGDVCDDQRDGPYIVVLCPVCSICCYGSPK